MSDVTIYHNGACSKSRGAMDLLRERGIHPHVVDYLSDPPDAEALTELLAKLGIGARDLVRISEPVYGELQLSEADDRTLLKAMVRHPILIQRPIVVVGDRAVIGRPPEKVAEILP